MTCQMFESSVFTANLIRESEELYFCRLESSDTSLMKIMASCIKITVDVIIHLQALCY